MRAEVIDEGNGDKEEETTGGGDGEEEDGESGGDEGGEEEEDSGEVEIIYHIVGVRCEGDECLFCREIHIRDENQESEGSQTHTEVRQI